MMKTLPAQPVRRKIELIEILCSIILNNSLRGTEILDDIRRSGWYPGHLITKRLWLCHLLKIPHPSTHNPVAPHSTYNRGVATYTAHGTVSEAAFALALLRLSGEFSMFLSRSVSRTFFNACQSSWSSTKPQLSSVQKLLVIFRAPKNSSNAIGWTACQSSCSVSL